MEPGCTKTRLHHETSLLVTYGTTCVGHWFTRGFHFHTQIAHTGCAKRTKIQMDQTNL
uniref:Uncharacterized protein n=1 Tax=Anguilla anguilla TaxID=7936 RepID=A0A0E9XWA3_ANGAN